MKQNRIQTIKQLLQYATVLILLFISGTACNEIEDTALNGEERAIQLTAYKPDDTSLTTKASPKETFRKGDKIHVSATFELKGTSPKAEYACMQYDDNGNWAACEGTKLTWPLKAIKATFTAYYIPNATSALADKEEVSKLSFSELSQWASTSADGGDPLKATCTDVSVGGAVYLQFAHMCTKLTFTNLDSDVSEFRLSGNVLSSGLTIKREGGLLTDRLSSVQSAITHKAKDGEISFLLPKIKKDDELKLFNRYTPYHLITVPHDLEEGKHYKLNITQLADNGYSADYKEEQWNKNPSGEVSLGPTDIEAYLNAISTGAEEGYIKDGIQILAMFKEGNNNVVTQLRDVNFGGNLFTPVNISTNIIFNGNGHTVKEVTISEVINEGNVALFGKNEGTIKNLILQNVVTTDKLSGSIHVGTLTAYNSGTIDNVKIKFESGNQVGGTIADGQQLWVGGLVGYNVGTIKNVVLSGNFTVGGTNSTDKIAHIGGLAGQTSGTMENCTLHNATVNATGNGTFRIGGLIGAIGDGSVSECSGSGRVNVSGGVKVVRAGGFAGYSSAKYPIEKCSSNATITVAGADQASIGGFIGQMENTAIDNCHATGTVVSGTITTSRGVAGLVGWLSYKGDASSRIINCSTISTVNATNGGFVGFVAENADGCLTAKNSNTSIHNSFSKNEATHFVTDGEGVTITNCHHNGKDMDGHVLTLDALNAGSVPGLQWTNTPDLYGVPYLNRNK